MGLGKEINGNQIFRDEKLHNTHAYINFHNDPQEHEEYEYHGSKIKIKKATIIVLHDDYDIQPHNFQIPSKGKLVLGKNELVADPNGNKYCFVLDFLKTEVRPPFKMKLSKIDFWVDIRLLGTKIYYIAFDRNQFKNGIKWDNRYCEALIP